MKKLVLFLFITPAIAFISCNQDELNQQKTQISSLKKDDSLKLIQLEKKDSSLNAFIKYIDRIQTSVDTIKRRENIISVQGESKKDNGAIIADLRAIGNQIAQDNAQMADLQSKLSASGIRNAGLEHIIARLKKEIKDKDNKIDSLESRLAETNYSLQAAIKKLNDTTNVVMNQRQTIGNMTTEMHTVYYTFGKKKDLQNKGVITGEGGFIGIGKTAVLNSNMNASKFTQADLTELTSIDLNGKLDQIITNPPNGSYKVVTGAKKDMITITNQQLFWSKSKYFVAIIR